MIEVGGGGALPPLGEGPVDAFLDQASLVICFPGPWLPPQCQCPPIFPVVPTSQAPAPLPHATCPPAHLDLPELVCRSPYSRPHLGIISFPTTSHHHHHHHPPHRRTGLPRNSRDSSLFSLEPICSTISLPSPTLSPFVRRRASVRSLDCSSFLFLSFSPSRFHHRCPQAGLGFLVIAFWPTLLSTH